jgi:peptidoglycan/xylan/chitin deacetylase (PgdA/CDA1 family)
MKRLLFLYFICVLGTAISCKNDDKARIRVNQLGYRPGDIKIAVFLSRNDRNLNEFLIEDVATGDAVYTGIAEKAASLDPFKTCYRLRFTGLKKAGSYRIVAGKTVSPEFMVSDDIYNGAADFLLNYMRQQRCGYNPYLRDSCHTRDGYEIYDSKNDSAHIDVTGGWHDAADYLQYVTTSANAVYQMLFAYSENPASFNDGFLADGTPGNDGVADVLNESRWGLDWLLKMNPSQDVMYNQIADDRDHIGFRYPDKDSANYGRGKERPVYLCTGKPQGLFKYKNRTTGIASTAGKFASAFARGSAVYRVSDAKFADKLRMKAEEAFSYGLRNPGVCQTAPGTAPYFYEEENWTDDMELAAIELYKLTGKKEYLDHAIRFGRQEEVTPWMGSDTARHYQWYPFVNMGHPGIARTEKGSGFGEFMKRGLELVKQKAEKNPFYVGVPFIWCSNNLVAGLLTQAHLYAEITGDSTFAELEAAHRDWLFGCNPWGTSMIVGLPEKGDYPVNTHSSYVVKGGQVPGGLVDGPVYSTIYNSLKYIYLSDTDEYAEFQTRLAVYHDDYADYSTNECTMDGTASLVYYLSSLHTPAYNVYNNPFVTIDHGGITRMDTTRKEIWLCFTAHDFNDGFSTITKTLKKHNIKASFFLTGDFCRNEGNRKIISMLKNDGHYIGPHSNKHLLYCSWEKRDSLLVNKDQFLSDLSENYKSLNKLGISRNEASVFLPSYEWFNDSIADWARQAGLKLVNISSGMKISQDWTYPRENGAYYSSDSLMNNFIHYERNKGLNGYILLIHPGTDPRRTDKFYLRLDTLINYLEKKNYSFRNYKSPV